MDKQGSYNVLATIAMMFAVMCFRYYHQNTEVRIDEDYITPADFTVGLLYYLLFLRNSKIFYKI